MAHRLLRKGENNKWGVLRQFVETIKRQHQRETASFGKDESAFLSGYRTCPQSAIAMAKIHELELELVPHSLYSLDLTPSDYHLFPNLKKWLDSQRFYFNSEVIAAINSYFDYLDSLTYNEGITNLEYRWNKCVERAGGYIEK